jgi:hypothetical protein
MLVLETGRSVLEQGVNQPETVRLPKSHRAYVITQMRLQRLQSGPLHLARLAAIMGEYFFLEAPILGFGWSLEQVSVAIEELETTEMMRGLRFCHDLIFEAILDEIPLGVQVLLHKAAMEALKHKGAPAAVLAYHASKSGQWAEAQTYSLQAAKEAEAILALEDAKKHLEDAQIWAKQFGKA